VHHAAGRCDALQDILAHLRLAGHLVPLPCILGALQHGRLGGDDALKALQLAHHHLEALGELRPGVSADRGVRPSLRPRNRHE
jgi:hypothetical protein